MASIEELEAVLARKEKLAKIDQLLAQKEGGTPPPAQPATVATSPADVPYYQAPDFIGQPYFDEQRKRLEAQLRETTKAHREWNGLPLPPFAPSQLPWSKEEKEFLSQRRGIESQMRQLSEDERKWGKGRPPEVATLPEWNLDVTQPPTEGVSRPWETFADLFGSEENDMANQLEKAGYNVEFVQGFPVVSNPDTGEKFQLNKPDLSPRDVKNFLSLAMQFFPSSKAAGMVGGGVKQGFKETGKQAFKRSIVGGAAAGATEAARQSIEEAIGGKFDLGEVGLASLFGGATELAIPALRGIWNKLSTTGREKLLAAQSIDDIKKLGIASESELKEIQSLVDRATTAQRGVKEATGVEVPIYRGQATGLPSQLLEQRYLAQLDPTSRKALDALRAQNEAAYEATVSIINSIAPEETIEFAGKQLRTSAEKAIADRRAIQVKSSSPIYKQAYRRQREGKVPLLDMSQFSTKYRNIAKQYTPSAPGKKDEIADTLRDIVDRVEGAGGDLRQLHNVKMHIDRLLEKTGEDSLARTSKRFISDVKKDLVNQLVEKSPSYRAARSEFIRTQGPVDELIDSMVGKVADLNDDQLAQATRKIFSRDATPKEVEAARKVIEQQDPNAWNQIVRRELWNRLSGLETTVAEQGAETVSNLAGKLRSSIFGNDNQRRILMQSVEGDSRKNLMYLDDILSVAASGRAAGSPTSPFQVLRDKLMGRFRVAKQAIANPLESAAKIGDETMFNRNARALADIVFDPEWAKRVSEIRALGNTPEAATKLSQLFDDVIRSSVQGTRPSTSEQPSEQIKRATQISPQGI